MDDYIPGITPMTADQAKAANEAFAERQFTRITTTYRRMLDEVTGDEQAAAILVVAFEVAMSVPE